MPLIIAATGFTPLIILLVSVVFIIAAIVALRLHAFFALIFAAVLVGILNSLLTAGGPTLVQSVDAVMTELGSATGKLAFTIAIASVIGAALMESGAAEKIVLRFIAVIGESRAPLALMACSFVLGIPVFFDTIFFLLVPLARSLALRTGKDFTLYLLAICVGGVVTHATVPPTPGPLAVAELLKIDIGASILFGLAVGIVPAIAGLLFAGWCNRRHPFPVSASLPPGYVATPAATDESKLPSFLASIAPVVLPLILIGIASVAAGMPEKFSPNVAGALAFLGNKNTALFIGALIAVGVYLRQKCAGWRDAGPVIGPPLETAGTIILITAAGGAFGAMIKLAGVGESVRSLTSDFAFNPVLLAWLLATVLRIAQGSTTVAMITAASIMFSLAGPGGFSVHPLYIFAACGYGGLSISWMNDSGFWIFSRMSGMTEGQTLRTWTPTIAVVALTGLVELVLLSTFFPRLGH
jgi:GntP family gluconate:H+ symporter